MWVFCTSKGRSSVDNQTFNLNDKRETQQVGSTRPVDVFFRVLQIHILSYVTVCTAS
jgi:hypothetical protein